MKSREPNGKTRLQEEGKLNNIGKLLFFAKGSRFQRQQGNVWSEVLDCSDQLKKLEQGEFVLTGF